MEPKVQATSIQIAGVYTKVELKLETGGWVIYKDGQRMFAAFRTSDMLAIAAAKKYVALQDEYEGVRQALRAKIEREIGHFEEVISDLDKSVNTVNSGNMHYLGYKINRGKIVPLDTPED